MSDDQQKGSGKKAAWIIAIIFFVVIFVMPILSGIGAGLNALSMITGRMP